MALPLTPDCDREAAAHLARLIVCDQCAGGHKAEQPQARQYREPYRDD